MGVRAKRRIGLKKRIFAIAVLVVIAAGGLAAQDSTNRRESEYFVHTIYLNQVFRHSMGFKVTYTAENLDFEQVYLPASWFRKAAGQGELVETNSRSAPYMDVYYRDGEFSHVRLFVRRNQSHPSWGRLEDEPNAAERFDVDTLEL